jgi:hypothetical protein
MLERIVTNSFASRAYRRNVFAHRQSVPAAQEKTHAVCPNMLPAVVLSNLRVGAKFGSNPFGERFATCASPENSSAPPASWPDRDSASTPARHTTNSTPVRSPIVTDQTIACFREKWVVAETTVWNSMRDTLLPTEKKSFFLFCPLKHIRYALAIRLCGYAAMRLFGYANVRNAKTVDVPGAFGFFRDVGWLAVLVLVLVGAASFV